MQFSYNFIIVDVHQQHLQFHGLLVVGLKNEEDTLMYLIFLQYLSQNNELNHK